MLSILNAIRPNFTGALSTFKTISEELKDIRTECQTRHQVKTVDMVLNSLKNLIDRLDFILISNDIDIRDFTVFFEKIQDFENITIYNENKDFETLVYDVLEKILECGSNLRDVYMKAKA